jgi:predicted PurR-regulated permease PerM
MARTPPTVEPHVERPGPTEFRDPLVRRELQRAAVWFGLALLIVGVIVLAQPLLLIIGGMIFAVLLDGGARLLGRVLPIGRGWRLAIVVLAGFGFIGWVFWFAGTTFAAQWERLRDVINLQATRLMEFAGTLGLMPDGQGFSLSSELLGSVGRLTSAVGSALGALTTMLLIIVIGIFIAAEPRLYDRGVAWMLPLRFRDKFYVIGDHVGWTLRRLLFGRLIAMLFEGVATWLLLGYVGQLFGVGAIPMAALLGLITGLLAFLPNIGALVSGILMVAVGFSVGPSEGVWAIFVYFFVQNVDAYLIVPYIARRTVDLAPALVLATQLLFGALFGILGILFADPILAALKVTLVELSKFREAEEGEGPATVSAAAVPGAVPPDHPAAASSRQRSGRARRPSRRK